jgi:predicted metal-dependent hydrolase
MQLEFPEVLDPLIIEGEPEMSYAFVGLSLLLPYLEPYLIRSMKAARPQVSDPGLLADLDAFNGQEGQHYKQHRAFNASIRAAGYDGLEAFEREVEADYQRFSATKPLAWNLAFAEGFEALTTASARFTFEMGLDGMHPAARDLFAWHLVEEFEHRTVAFEVYDHVCGSYPYRLRVGAYAQWHTIHFALRVALHLGSAKRDVFDELGGWRGWARRQLRLGRDLLVGMLPKVIRTYAPGYTPREIELPAAVAELGAHYSERAVQVG